MTLTDSNAGDVIRAMMSGYSSKVRSKKLLAMMQAYVDDSAIDDGDRRLFLAGYINTADKWAEFSDKWEAALSASPSISYFKMSEAFAFRGEFLGWDCADRDKKIHSLGTVIRNSNPISIHSSISRVDVDEIIKPVAPYGMASPYGYCFDAIMLPLANMQVKSGSSVPIDFIFDSQDGLGEQARELFKMMREMQSPDVKKLISVDPIFRDDKLVLPLQAADMLAWHIRRRYYELDDDSWFVPDYMAVEGGHHIGVDFPTASVKRIASGLKQLPILANYSGKSAWKKVMKKVIRLRDLGIAPSFNPSDDDLL